MALRRLVSLSYGKVQSGIVQPRKANQTINKGKQFLLPFIFFCIDLHLYKVFLNKEDLIWLNFSPLYLQMEIIHIKL